MRIYIFLVIISTFLFSKPLSLSEAFKHQFNSNSQGINIEILLGKEIYLYQKELKILLDDKDITSLISLPKPSNRVTELVFDKNLQLNLPQILLDDKVKNNAFLEIHFQGCSEQGLCYKPQILYFKISKKNNLYELSENNFSPQNITNTEQSIASNMQQKSFILTLLSFFVYGLLLSLTPCTLPMIPILSSLIIAKGTQNTSKKTALWLSFIYVFFMSLAYALAGIIASFLGASLQGLLQQTWILILFAAIFILLALSMFGLFKLELPLKFQNFIQKKSKKGKGILGIAIMGFLSALIIGPCVAAPLAGALIYIANSNDILLGGLALFFMSFGMGIPLFLVGFGISFLKAGIWMQKVQIFFGFLMLAMAIWILSRIFNTSLILILFGIWGVFLCVFMGLFEKESGIISKFKKALLILLLSYSLSLFLGGLFGGKSFLKPFEFNTNLQNNNLKFNSAKNLQEIKSALKNNEKTLLYFTASWCENCKLLENFTFSDALVQAELKKYYLVKVDLSKNGEQENKIMKEFGIFGPPVLSFFEKEQEKFKITGFINRDEFLQKIK